MHRYAFCNDCGSLTEYPDETLTPGCEVCGSDNTHDVGSLTEGDDDDFGENGPEVYPPDSAFRGEE